MKVTGTHVLRTSPDRVWEALRDPQVLARTIPGCRDVQRTADGDYRVRVHATVASVAGTCESRVEVTDVAGHACTVRVTASGEPGTVAGTASLDLVADGPARTQARYHADAVIGGAIGTVGQRVLAGVAQRGATQFFEAVDRHLAGDEEAPPLDGPLVRAAPAAARKLLAAGLAGAVIAVFVVLLARRYPR